MCSGDGRALRGLLLSALLSLAHLTLAAAAVLRVLSSYRTMLKVAAAASTCLTSSALSGSGLWLRNRGEGIERISCENHVKWCMDPLQRHAFDAKISPDGSVS